jgi:hypothetical protein
MASNLKVTELDFFQIRENFKTYLQSQDKFRDYDFEGSGMSVLLDVLSYNTHYNAINAHMAMNEVFLDTAQLRNNVVSHAKMLGYVPRSQVSSFALIDVTVINPIGTPSTLTIDAGTEFSSVVDGTQYTFTVLESKSISPVNGVYKFENLKVNEGSIRTFSYVVDNFDQSQYFEVPDNNADISTLIVKVRANSSTSSFDIYTLARNFVDIKSDTPAYFLQESMDGKYEVYFGDGVVGKKLQAGNVVELQWLSTNAGASNGASEFTLASSIQGNSNVVIDVLFKSAGGGDREDIDSIKFNAPLSYVSQNRVVTPEDYKAAIINNYPNIETVTVWGGEENIPPDYGKAYISIKPKNAETLTVSEKQFIKDQILKSRNVVSITPELVDPTYTYVALQVFVKYDPNLTNKTAGELRQSIVDTISEYNDLYLKKFDGVFRHSQLSRLIDQTDPSILNCIVRVSMQKRFVPTIGSKQKYTLEFSSPLCNIRIYASAIMSSAFMLNGFTQYLQDEPIIEPGADLLNTPDITDHIIYAYRLVGDTKVITISDAGRVYSDLGIVELTDFDAESFEGDYITIIGIPSSDDIAPKRNQLLQIDMSQVSVVAEVDTIATGGSIAGIGYRTTPKIDF